MAVKSQEITTSLLDELPKFQWRPNFPLHQYKGYWLSPWAIESLAFIETHYKPLHGDVLLVSFPKCGTTWLKAITLAILHNQTPNDPLQTHSPHQLVPILGGETFGKNTPQKFDEIASPRIYSTHFPFSVLPENVKNSKCKIVYICRDPADAIVSGWHFSNKVNEFGTLEEYFKEVVEGTTLAGPLFDHMLEYWEERERENVLFLTYEELKAYPNDHVKRIAEFLGCQLSDDEIEQVVRKSSFERLSKLDCNNGEKGDKLAGKVSVKYNLFFRNGSVGDGKKCLTSEMKKRLKDVAYEKWGGSGLESKLLNY